MNKSRKCLEQKPNEVQEQLDFLNPPWSAFYSSPVGISSIYFCEEKKVRIASSTHSNDVFCHKK